MLRLKSILLEGTSDPLKTAIAIGQWKFKHGYGFRSQRANPEDPNEIIYTFSNGQKEEYLAKTPRPEGNDAWYVRKNNRWSMIPQQVLRQIFPSPSFQDLTAKMAVPPEVAQKLQAPPSRKNPITPTDNPYVKTNNADLDFYLNNSGLSEREHKVVELRSKGYTLAEIGETYNVGVERVRTIYNRAIEKMRVTAKLEAP